MMKKRLISLLLVIIMLFSMAPTVLAADTTFSDVKSDAWYYAPVMWAVENGITGGIGNGMFGPENTCTRGQVVTFLWAAAGKPDPVASNNPFTDVSSSDWYFKSVMWAVQNGITSGTSDTTFSPDNSCTRAQVATFLYASQGKPAYDTAVSPFTDVASSDWFFAPVMWAVENDVTGGIGNGQFGPNNLCTRAQVATFLYKADQVEEEIGTMSNPIPADNDVIIERGNRQFMINCTNVLRGSAANQLAASENSRNATPGYGQEWRFYEFNVTYVSTTGGDSDYVWGSDLISDEQLYSADGSALSVIDTADLGEQYLGYDVLETSMCMYPGSSTKMVLGILVSQNAGDVLLRVDNGNDAAWIKCDAYSSSLDKNSSGPKIPNDRYINSAANGSITFTYDSAKVTITTAGVITGDAAYKQLNQPKPADNQEWRIYKLKVANVSSSSYSYVFVNHLIGNGNIFRTNGVILPWFGDTSLDSSAMSKQLYAGDSVTVSYAILTDKDAGDAMLRVFDGNQTKWLMLGGSGSSTPGGDSDMAKGEQLAAYVKETGSLNHNGNITVTDSYTVNGNRVDVSVIYSASGDHLMLDAVIHLSTGKFQTSFDYDYKNMKAKTNSIYVHATNSGYPVISYTTKAAFNVADYTANTSLNFTKFSGMNEPYNYVTLSNAAVQVAMKAWDMFVEDTIGCGLNELGFDSYTN